MLDTRLNEFGIRIAECGIKIQNPRSLAQTEFSWIPKINPRVLIQ